MKNFLATATAGLAVLLILTGCQQATASGGSTGPDLSTSAPATAFNASVAAVLSTANAKVTNSEVLAKATKYTSYDKTFTIEGSYETDNSGTILMDYTITFNNAPDAAGTTWVTGSIHVVGTVDVPASKATDSLTIKTHLTETGTITATGANPGTGVLDLTSDSTLTMASTISLVLVTKGSITYNGTTYSVDSTVKQDLPGIE